MTLYDEINLIIEQLQATWGVVIIACDGSTCTVTDAMETEVYEAPTLIEALRLAQQGGEV